MTATVKDFVELWQQPTLGGVMLLHARYHAQRFPRHVHEEYVVGINAGGAHSFYSHGSTHIVPPGSIALVNSDTVHTGEPASTDTWEYRAFYPTSEFLKSLWADATEGREAEIAFREPVVYDPELAAALGHANAVSQSAEDRLAGDTLVLESLLTVVRRYASIRDRSLPAPDGMAAERAREFIHAHPSRAISLLELSNAAGIGRTSVVRAFRREFGMAPYEYVIALRVAQAKRLLAAGRPVSDVALTCGFGDQSHMHRHFRRVVGIGPGAYGRAARPRRTTTG